MSIHFSSLSLADSLRRAPEIPCSSILALLSVLVHMEPIVKASVLFVKRMSDQLFEFILGLFLTHFEEHRVDQVLDIILLQLFNVWDNHQVEQVDEHVGALPEDLESLAALHLEFIESILLNLLFSRRILHQLLMLDTVEGALGIRQMVDAFEYLNVLLNKLLIVSH